MEISEELKIRLIADVENVCDIKLDEEIKKTLMRCFEITIDQEYGTLNYIYSQMLKTK
jgi:hypothetical protein